MKPAALRPALAVVGGSRDTVTAKDGAIFPDDAGLANVIPPGSSDPTTRRLAARILLGFLADS